MNTNFLNRAPIRTASRCLALVTLATAGLSAHAGVIDTILSRVNTINTKASQIRAKTNLLENRPSVRDLANQIAPDLVGDMMSVAQTGQDAVAILNEQRLGFVEYRDNGGADTMRNDLRYVFDDIRTLHTAAQQLRCFEDPEVSIVGMNVDFMSRAVDHIPAIALYGMQKALDEVVPEWRTTVSDINASLPIEQAAALCGTASDVAGEFERMRCEVLRNVNPTRLSRTQRKAKILARLFGIIKEYSPDEVTVQFSLTVVGGAGAGTSIKLPLKGIFQTLISVLNRIEDVTGKVAGERQACLDADEKIERDVLACAALASYDTNLESVRDVVLRRLMSLGAGSQVWNAVDNAQSFGQICNSYREYRLQ